MATRQRFADVSQNLTTGIQVVALSALQSQSKYSEARRSAARILELQSAMNASVPILLSTVRRSGASCIEHHRNMSDIDVLHKVPLSLSAFNNSLATQKRPIVRELRRIGDGKVVHDLNFRQPVEGDLATGEKIHICDVEDLRDRRRDK